jgi:hypothetical protein
VAVVRTLMMVMIDLEVLELVISIVRLSVVDLVIYLHSKK